ncbi:DNA repair protein rad50 [Phlyctochytrium planicorne]|nr:DNA repair protein rad50 [Phlyctochytrium planicorne]
MATASRIDSLTIRGIRSFVTTREEEIHFTDPLTLIMGQNGSGKTTIIECLKYATTGIQPPNTKMNAGFVTDPKISNEVVVKGQVKLQFHNVKGEKTGCIRSLQVTRTAKGLSQKTLDNVIIVGGLDDYDDTKKTAITRRCADIDVEMSNLLGVSLSMLDNVIFCHQENSLWPLSEATVLKTIFDEIFSVTQYTKALELFKNYRKDQKSLLGTQKERVKHAAENKNKAVDLQAKMEVLQQKIEEGNARREKIESNSIANTSGEIRTIESAIHNVEKLKNKILLLESDSNNLQKNIRELHNITELEDDTADLYIILESSNDTVNRNRQEKLTLEGQISQFEMDLKAKQGKTAELLQEKGKLEAEQKIIDRKNIEKESILRDIRSFLKLHDASFPENSSDIPKDSLSNMLKQYIESLAKSAMLSKETFEKEQKQLMLKEQDLRTNLDSSRNLRLVLEKQQQEKSRKLSSLNKKHESLPSQDSNIVKLNQDILEEEEKLASLKHTSTQKDLSNSISALDRELSDLEHARAVISENLRALHQLSDLRTDIAAKRGEIAKNISRYEEKFVPR